LVNTIGCVGAEASTATVSPSGSMLSIKTIQPRRWRRSIAACSIPARCGGAAFRAAIAARSSGDTRQQRRREPR